MSSVDERVIKMVMESSQFETAAEKTLSLLDKIKETASFQTTKDGITGLADALKGIDVSNVTGAAEQINKLDFGSLSQAINNVNSHFNLLGRIGEEALERISKAAVDCGQKILSALNQLTIQPLTTGFNEYELLMDSTQVILANTGRDLEDVKNTLNELNHYADKTIYNFAQMTQNIGRFTAAGVGLEDATTAIEGLSNLSALVGVNAEGNSRAMYNLSQALSTGRMMLQDWKSFENTGGLAGKVFREELIATAKELGYFEKAWENAKGGSISGAELLSEAEKHFRETLKWGWVDNDVLIKTLAKFNDETTELGQKALKAATEVRTFTKMWDALTEAAQSGWSQSYQYIFGDYEEGTTLWTAINDEVSLFINGISDARNGMLEFWHDNGGRDQFIEGLGTVYEKIKELATPIGQAIKDNFSWANLLPEEKGQAIVDLSTKFNEWAHSLTVTHEEMDKIYRALNLFFYPLKEFKNFLSWGGLNNILLILKSAKDSIVDIVDVFNRVIYEKVSDIPLASFFVNVSAEISEALREVSYGIAELKNGKLYSTISKIYEPLRVFLTALTKIDISRIATPIQTIYYTILRLSDLLDVLFSALNSSLDEKGITDFLDAIVFAFTRITSYLPSIVYMVTDWTSNLLKTAPVFETIGKIFGLISEFVTSVAQTFASWLDVGKFREDLDHILSPLRLVVETLSNADYTPLEEALEKIVNLFISIVDKASTLWGKLFEDQDGAQWAGRLTHAFEILNSAVDIVSGAVDALFNVVLGTFSDSSPLTFLGRIADGILEIADYAIYALDIFERSGALENSLIGLFKPVHMILDRIRNTDFTPIVNSIKSIIDMAVYIFTAIGQAVGEMFNSDDIIVIENPLQNIVNFVGDIVQKVHDLVFSPWGFKVIQGIVRYFISSIRIMYDVIGQIASVVAPLISTYITPILTKVGEFTHVIGEIYVALEKVVKQHEIIKKLIETIKAFVEPWINLLSDALSGIADMLASVYDAAAKVFEMITGIHLPTFDEFKSLSTDLDEIGPKVEDLGFKFSKALIDMKSKASEFSTGATTAVRTEWDTLMEIFSQPPRQWVPLLAEHIKNGLLTVWGKIKSIWKDMFGGVEEDGSVVVGKFGGENGPIMSALKSFFTNLREFIYGFGDWIGINFEGIAGKIKEKFEALKAWLEARGLKFEMPSFDGIFDGLGKAIDWAIEKLGQLFEFLKKIPSFIRQIFGAKEVYGATLEDIPQAVEEEGAQIIKAFGFLEPLRKIIEGFLSFITSILSGGEYGGINASDLLEQGGSLYTITILHDMFMLIFEKLKALGGTTEAIRTALTTGIASISASIVGMFNDIGKAFSKVAAEFPKLVSNFTKNFDILTKSVNKGITRVTKGVKRYLTGKAINEAATGLLKFAAAIGVIALSMYVLSKIPEDKLKVCGAIVAVIAGALVAVAIALAKFNRARLDQVQLTMAQRLAPAIQKLQKSLSGFLKNAGLAAMIVAFAIAIGKLVKAVMKLGNMDYESLTKGLLATIVLVGSLVAALAILFKVSEGKSVSISGIVSMIALAISVKMLASAVVKIGKLDNNKIITASICLGSLMIVLGAMIAVTQITGYAKVGPLIALAASIWVLSKSVVRLAKVNQKKLTKASVALGALMALFAVMEVASSFLASGTQVLAGVVLMGAVVAGLSLLLTQMTKKIGKKVDTYLKIAEGLGVIIASLSAMMVALGVAGNLLKNPGAGMGALEAIGLIDVFIVSLIAVIGAIGGVVNLIDEKFGGAASKAFDKAIEVFAKIGEAFGRLAGGVVGGFTAEKEKIIAEQLPEIADAAAKFTETVKGIKPKNFKGISSLVEAIFTLTKNDLLSGISSFLGGGDSVGKFNTTLDELVPALVTFSEQMKGVETKQASKAAKMLQTLVEVSNSVETNGGLKGFIFGEGDLGTFAEDLEKFVPQFQNYLSSLSNLKIIGEDKSIIYEEEEGSVVDPAKLEKAIGWLNDIIEASKNIPKNHGILQGIIGGNALDSFGKDLEKFTPKFESYLTTIGGLHFTTKDDDIVYDDDIQPESLDTAIKYLNKLIKVSKKIPKNKSILGNLITGEGDLGTFGDDLAKFGPGLQKCLEALGGMHFSDTEFGEDTVNTESVQKAVDMVNAFKDLAGAIEGTSGYLIQVFGTDTSLAGIGTGLETLGTGITEYAGKLYSVNWTNANKGINFMKRVLNEFNVSEDQVASVERLATVPIEQAMINMSNTMSMLSTAFSGVFNDTDVISSIQEQAANLGAVILEGISNGLNSENENGDNTACSAMKNLFRTLMSTAKEYLGFKTASEEASAGEVATPYVLVGQSIVSGIAKGITDELTTKKPILKKEAKKFVESIFDQIRKTTDECIGSATDTESLIGHLDDVADRPVNTFLNGMYFALYYQESNFKDDMMSCFNRIIDAGIEDIKGRYNDMYNAGIYVIEGFIAGINSKTQDAIDALNNLATASANAVTTALEIQSPSKLFMRIGAFLPEGLAIGIRDNAHTALNTLQDRLIKPFNSMTDLFGSDTVYRPTIQPVVDLSDVNRRRSQINNMFGSRSVELTEAVMSISQHNARERERRSIQKVYNDHNIISAISDFRSDFASLQSSIEGLGLYIDGDNLVGRIVNRMDRNLGINQMRRRRSV